MKKIKRESERQGRVSSAFHKNDENAHLRNSRVKRIRKCESRNRLSPNSPDSSYSSNCPEKENEINHNVYPYTLDQEGALPPQSPHDTEVERSEIIHLDSPPKDFNFSVMMDSGNPNNEDDLHLDEQIEEQFRLAAANLNKSNSTSLPDFSLVPNTASIAQVNRNTDENELDDNGNQVMKLEIEFYKNPTCQHSPGINSSLFQEIPHSKFLRPFKNFVERFDDGRITSIFGNNHTKNPPKIFTDKISAVEPNNSSDFQIDDSSIPAQLQLDASEEGPNIVPTEPQYTNGRSLGRDSRSDGLSFTLLDDKHIPVVRSRSPFTPLNSESINNP